MEHDATPDLPPPSEVDLPAELRRLREASGLSIRALSAASDVPASTIGGYLTGRHTPSHDESWQRVLTALGVTDRAVREWLTRAAHHTRRRRRAAAGAADATPDPTPDPTPGRTSGPSSVCGLCGR